MFSIGRGKKRSVKISSSVHSSFAKGARISFTKFFDQAFLSSRFDDFYRSCVYRFGIVCVFERAMTLTHPSIVEISTTTDRQPGFRLHRVRQWYLKENGTSLIYWRVVSRTNDDRFDEENDTSTFALVASV